MRLTAPNGVVIDVAIPAGARPGATFEVAMPPVASHPADVPPPPQSGVHVGAVVPPPNPDRARAFGYSSRRAGKTRAPGRLPIIDAKPRRARSLNKTGGSELTVKPKGLEPGRYRVLCRVKDTTKPRGERTPWVLKDTEGLLESERGWWVRVPAED